MKKLCKKTVLYRFFILYMALCGLIVLLLIPIYTIALSSTRDNFTDKIINSIHRSTDQFRNSVNSVMLLHSSLGEDSLFLEVKNYKEEQIAGKEMSKLLNMHRSFKKLTSSIDLVSEVFILFDKHSVILSKNRIYRSEDECFGKFIVYEDYNSDEIYKLLLSLSDPYKSSYIKFMGNSTVRLNSSASSEYITLTTRYINGNTTMCALYNREELLTLFDMHNFPEDAFLYMVDSNGNQLFSFNNEETHVMSEDPISRIRYGNKKYTLLCNQVPDIGCTVYIGIPNSYFTSLVQPVAHQIIIDIVVAIGIGILVGGIMATYNYRPIKKLVNMSLPESISIQNKNKANEYDYLSDVMNHMNQTNNMLKTNITRMECLLRKNMFVRLLCGVMPSHEDRGNVISLLPQVEEPYRIIVFSVPFRKATDTVTVTDSVCLYDMILTKVASNIPIARIGDEQIALITSEAEWEAVRKCINEIVKDMKQSCRDAPAVGISEKCDGMETIQKAYYQAQFCIASSNCGSIIFYKRPAEKKLGKIIDFNKLQMLYKAIMTGNKEKVNKIFSQITELITEYGSSKEEVRQIYYLLRYAPVMATAFQEYEDSNLILPVFSEALPVSELIEGLASVCRELCDANRRDTDQKSYYNQIMQYIHEHFCDPDLYADTISSAFNISNRQVFRIVRKLTGQSASEYIEHLRMEKSLEYLKDTSEPIKDIAENCGFYSTNTFYKSFKKHFGIPPSEYRNMMSQGNLSMEYQETFD